MNRMRTLSFLILILTAAAMLLGGCGRKAATPTGMTTSTEDPFALLRADHRAVEGLVGKAINETDATKRMDLVRQIHQALLPHMMAEEKVLYPILQGVQKPEDRALAVTAADEHKAARDVLMTLERSNLDATQYAAELTRLRDMLNTHISREENQIFGAVSSMYNKNQLTQLGSALKAEKLRAMQMKPTATPATTKRAW